MVGWRSTYLFFLASVAIGAAASMWSATAYAQSHIALSIDIKLPALKTEKHVKVTVNPDVLKTICIPLTMKIESTLGNRGIGNLFITTLPVRHVEVGMIVGPLVQAVPASVLVANTVISSFRRVSRSVVYGVASNASGTMSVSADFGSGHQEEPASRLKVAVTTAR